MSDKNFSDRQLEQVQIRDAENRRSTCISRAGSGTPPGWLLDKIAEEKLKGGFNTSKKNLCPECHEYRSLNGACGCPE